MHRALLIVLLAGGVQGEPRVLTLKQSLALAAEQNPEVLLARLDEQKAQLAIRIIQEPLIPKLVAGSGLAYTYGMPMSVEGSAPTVVQARAIRSIWDPSRGLMLAKAREDARSSGLEAAIVRDEVLLRTAMLHLDLERAQRAVEAARRQEEHLQRIEAAVRIRVEEGRQLPIDARRATVNLMQVRRRLSALGNNVEAHSLALAQTLGLDPNDGVRAALEQRPAPALPEGEQEAVAAALASSKEIRKLESALAAKNLEARAHRASRWPRIDLIAQYGLLAKFNNYSDYFSRFQRHNAQLGASFQVPLFGDDAAAARAAQAEVEARRLMILTRQARSRIESDTRAAWRRIRDSEAGRDFARMDLELAREQVSVLLAQQAEGRAGLQQIEQARLEEQDKWLALYEAEAELERARLNLLRQTEMLAQTVR